MISRLEQAGGRKSSQTCKSSSCVLSEYLFSPLKHALHYGRHARVNLLVLPLLLRFEAALNILIDASSCERGL